MDECSEYVVNYNCPHGECINLIGSYNCTCDQGYGDACKPQS